MLAAKLIYGKSIIFNQLKHLTFKTSKLNCDHVGYWILNSNSISNAAYCILYV